MPKQLAIKIAIGNDAMQDGADLAEAPRKIANEVESGDTFGAVYDANGNSVGAYQIA